MGIESATGGVRKNYGPRTTENKVPSVHNQNGADREYVVDFSYDSLPSASEVDNLVQSIAAGSLIKSAVLKVGTAWAGGTSLSIGLAQADGTAIDADGIDAAVATASLTAGAVIVCDGALIGASVGANPGQIVASTSGSYTAGTARLVVVVTQLP